MCLTGRSSRRLASEFSSEEGRATDESRGGGEEERGNEKERVSSRISLSLLFTKSITQDTLFDKVFESPRIVVTSE